MTINDIDINSFYTRQLEEKTLTPAEIEYLPNAPLSQFCTFGIGGETTLFIAHSTKAMLIIAKFCVKYGIKFKVIGLGANLLFDDKGYKGIIIVNAIEYYRIDDTSIILGAGVTNNQLMELCIEYGLTGLENLAGIPATMGGAITNNLGALGCQISDVVEYVDCYSLSNLDKKIRLTNTECAFSYRDSIFKHNNYIITEIKLNLKRGLKDNIHKQIISNIIKKINSQPIDHASAGSIFKRGDIIPALVIDQLGLKGTRVGGACVSSKHSGFIINDKNAKSSDVKQLITLIKTKVKTALNADLTEEIEIVDY